MTHQPPTIPPREPDPVPPVNDDYIVDVSAWDLTKRELGRFKGGMGKAALAFLVLVPTLLAAIYLWANWDPLGHLDRLPVALVNEDKPAPAGGTGQEVAGGTALVTQLTTSPLLGWQTVSADQAKEGLEDGDFYGVLKIPADFSARLGSPVGDDPQRASVSIELNDANNYLAGVAFGTQAVDLQNDIDAAAQAAYADAAFAGYDVLTKGFGAAAADANTLATNAGKAHGAAADLSASLGDLESNARDVKVSTGDTSKGVAGLVTGLQKSADAVSDAVAKLQAAISAADDAAATTPATTPDDDAAADDTAAADTSAETQAIQDAADELKDAGSKAGDNVEQVDKDAQLAAKQAAALRTEASTANDDGETVSKDTKSVATEAQTLADGLNESAGSLPTGSDESRQQLADVLVHPVSVKVHTLNPAGAYGRGMAPLFLAIGLWAFALIVFLLMRPVAEEALPTDASSLQLAFGAFLPAALVGTGGAVVLFLVGLVLGLDPDSPIAAFLLLLLGIWSFTAVVQALRLLFGGAGLAVGLFLLVIQVAACNGVYPPELGPGLLEAISPILPFTWIVQALRVTISGGVGSDVTTAAILLIVLTIVAVALSTWAVSRKRGHATVDVTPQPQPQF